VRICVRLDGWQCLTDDTTDRTTAGRQTHTCHLQQDLHSAISSPDEFLVKENESCTFDVWAQACVECGLWTVTDDS